MIKLKGLKPSLREKKRYIVYKVDSSEKVNMFSFQESLIKKLAEMLGIFTPAGLIPVKFNNKTKQGIIRVNHTAVDLVRSCFVLINRINQTQVSIHTSRVTGVLKIANESLEG